MPRRIPAFRALQALLLIGLGLPLLVWALHPWPVPLRWKDPGTTAFMESRLRDARGSGQAFELRHAWVPLDELPDVLVRAVLVAEDDRFHLHAGIDWEALAEEVRYRGPLPPRLRDAEDRAALREAWRYASQNRDRVRGRSTLTQQLARNLYLSEDRSFIRKAQEALIARRLEFFLPKERILEIYLNVAEFGPGIFGVEAAAQAYFDRSARALTRHQAASLAATLPHPLTSNPATNPGRMAWRRDLVLARLGGGPPVAPAPPDVLPVELPDSLLPPPPSVLPPDTVPPDTVPPDTVPPDTLRPDTLRPDTLRPG
jgi:monofunctional glycosyltransferase